MDNLYIFGADQFASLVRSYFEKQGRFQVRAFCVDDEFVSASYFEGIEVVPFSEISKRPGLPESFFYSAIGYSSMNQNRVDSVERMKSLGLRPASFVSEHSTILTSQRLESLEHLFIMEGNIIQEGAVLSNNVVLWSGNHIGHHSSVGEGTFVSSHVVVSGNVSIGRQCFLGVNSTLVDGISLGEKTYVAAGAVVTHDTMEKSLIHPATASKEILGGASFA